MTAAMRDDSRSEPEDDEVADVRWNDRAMFGSFRGLPWWAAVLIAFVLAIVGTFVDVGSATHTVGWVFAITFFVGCVGAVVFVERRSMFGPIVQPPLILAIVVPVLVVFTQGMPSGGLAAAGLALGKPLIDGFPAMAVTTACTVILGIIRVTTQKDPNRPTKDEIREAKRKPDKPRRPERPERSADRAERSADRTEKPQPEDRPKRPRGEAPERRRPASASASASDEDRPKRPRPPAAGAVPADRPRRPAAPREGGRPTRRPRPRDED
ncbi:hypothetical protein ALI22I_25895 [Saccharothrix sp. ALI-22-I]|uniref:DUF6542 domain-containing protein n=1 Tax=Saccharothrix sp. ALI-22-I TaxID=1933778 RepID=UPI00097C248A|nr:DUF6542 domain-containing protein [Saccharothrix sp. ALI-22-I]ONI86146.1 hypothetical protein ALI22I_25895 [Saccharothrix sp. ALI-22-I]